MTPDDYCATAIGGPGSNLYYSLMFLPPTTRHAGAAVYAFAREIADVAQECREPDVAHAKFDWWREEIARCYAGAARHPVTQAFAGRTMDREALLAMITAAETTIGGVRLDTVESLHAHCHATGSIREQLAASVFGSTDHAAGLYAQTLGLALRLTEILVHLGRDVRRDRLYLPRESLRRFGVAEDDVLACRHTPAFEALMAHETGRATQLFDEAIARLPERDRARQLPGLIQAAIARMQLDEMRRDGYRALERHVALTPMRKLWIAWSTRIRERHRASRVKIPQDERA